MTTTLTARQYPVLANMISLVRYDNDMPAQDTHTAPDGYTATDLHVLECSAAQLNAACNHEDEKLVLVVLGDADDDQATMLRDAHPQLMAFVEAWFAAVIG